MTQRINTLDSPDVTHVTLELHEIFWLESYRYMFIIFLIALNCSNEDKTSQTIAINKAVITCKGNQNHWNNSAITIKFC